MTIAPASISRRKVIVLLGCASMLRSRGSISALPILGSQVAYTGAKPTNFEDATSIVAIGTFDGGVFTALSMIAVTTMLNASGTRAYPLLELTATLVLAAIAVAMAVNSGAADYVLILGGWNAYSGSRTRIGTR